MRFFTFSAVVDKLVGSVMTALQWMSSRWDVEEVLVYVEHELAVVVAAVASVGQNIAGL